MLKKISFKISFYEKVKMTTKGTTILGSFVIVGLFDCDLTHHKSFFSLMLTYVATSTFS